jgi:hypothetical protein
MRFNCARRGLRAAASAALLSLGAATWTAAPAVAKLTFSVSARPAPVRAIPPGFVGLALEYRSVPQLVGPNDQPVDPLLLAFIHDLAPTGGPPLRIGGQSTDRSWWPVPGMQRPLGITYDLSRNWALHARRLAAALSAKLILGIGLEANSPRIEQLEGRKLAADVGTSNIGGFEIGNEPELYTVVPWYRTVHGHPVPWYDRTASPVFSRSPTWNPQQFDDQFARGAGVLPQGIPLVGPATGDLKLLASFEHRFLHRGSRLETITRHAYGLDGCVTDPTNPQYPSVPNLLSLGASRGFLSGIGPALSAAHRAGASFRLAEMGSISCNGHAGVSNVFASALWLLDGLFASAAAGVDGVNLHTYPGLLNALFDITEHRRQWSAEVHPMFYGALLFSQAAPAGARLLPVRSPSPGQLRTWATLGPDGRVRVVLINDSLRDPAHVALAVAGARGPGSLERLQAPSPYSTSGVTLGGRSFADPSPVGQLPPPLTREIPGSRNGFQFTVPRGTAAMLTVARRP